MTSNQRLEIIRNFTLTAEDHELLPDRTPHGLLVFAIMLKFLQAYGRFPTAPNEVSDEVVDYVAEQLEVTPHTFREFDWNGRTIKRYRARIREVTQFRESTAGDVEKLTQWLVDHLDGGGIEAAQELAYERLRQLFLEPPTSERMNRIARSAVYVHERRLYNLIFGRLSPDVCRRLKGLLETSAGKDVRVENDEQGWERSPLAELRKDPGPPGLESVLEEVAKLERIRSLDLPLELFRGVPHKFVTSCRQRAASEAPRELRRHPDAIHYALLSAFCFLRCGDIVDNLVDLLIQVVHRIGTRAERKVIKELIQEFIQVKGKTAILFRVAEAAVDRPDGMVREVIFPIVGEETLRALIKEFKSTGAKYRVQVQTRMRSSYGHHYRRMLPRILAALEFRSNNEVHRPVIRAIDFLKRHADSSAHYYPHDAEVPIDGIVPEAWRKFVIKDGKDGRERVNRIAYELCLLERLRERLRTKEVWVVGAYRYRNPDEDVPRDFAEKRAEYYDALKLPIDAGAFISKFRRSMADALDTLNRRLHQNPGVDIVMKGRKPWICVSPLKAKPSPPNLEYLKKEVSRRWPMTSLLDILKETDLRVNFTDQLKSVAVRETIVLEQLRKRKLLCLYAIGTNLGIKRVSAGDHGEKYDDLLYVAQRFINKNQLREAIAQVVNGILAVRLDKIWGKGTTTCAGDSKRFGAWDQNLMSEWHARYGGPGIMVYWHVEKNAACIYSQLKRCSSSEVASMIQGVLHHCTEMEIDRQYVDSHGQSHVAFAFCHLLGFRLLPRLKAIGRQRLYRPWVGEPDTYPRLQPILTRPINWDLIQAQYDEMIKFATALRLGTADAEAILRRFTRDNLQHPTYQALVEFGRAVKTIFLCDYLSSENLRREVHEALNIIELWNGVNDFIFYGRGGEISTNRREDQEIAMLCLHLLQNTLVYVNTLMIQQILDEPGWPALMTPRDLQAPTPLIHAHVNPYGSFRLDLAERLRLDPEPADVQSPKSGPQSSVDS